MGPPKKNQDRSPTASAPRAASNGKQHPKDPNRVDRSDSKGSAGRPASAPRRETAHPRKQPPAPYPEEEEAPPPSGCFCFFRKPKPKSDPKPKPPPPSSKAPARAETSSPPPRRKPSEVASSSKSPPAASTRKESPSRVPENKNAVIKPPVKSPSSSPMVSDGSGSSASASAPPQRAMVRKLSPKEMVSTSMNGTGRASPNARNESELDSVSLIVAPTASENVRRSITRLPGASSGRDTLDRSVVGTSKDLTAPFAPVASTSAANNSNNSGFAESNKMYEACGIRFDRNQFTGAGESVANSGDQHLVKLEEACRQLIQKVHPDTRHRLSRSELSNSSSSLNISRSTVAGTSPSATSILAASASQTLPNQLSFSSSASIGGVTGITFPSVAPVPSARFVEASITMTEVLQLQCRPKEAVTVLSRAIDEVNADMAAMRARKQAAKGPFVGVISRVHANNTYDIDYDDGEKETNVKMDSLISDGDLKLGAKVKIGVNRTPPTPEEYEQLRKLKAACHRRIGSLYVSYGKYKEAEDHVLKYLSYLEKSPVTIAQKNEMAYTFSVLACIYDQLGRSEEAVMMDFKAIEGATVARKMETS